MSPQDRRHGREAARRRAAQAAQREAEKRRKQRMPALKDIGADGATWIWAPFGLKSGLHALTVVVTGDGVQASRFEYSVQ